MTNNSLSNAYEKFENFELLELLENKDSIFRTIDIIQQIADALEKVCN